MTMILTDAELARIVYGDEILERRTARLLFSVVELSERGFLELRWETAVGTSWAHWAATVQRGGMSETFYARPDVDQVDRREALALVLDRALVWLRQQAAAALLRR